MKDDKYGVVLGLPKHYKQQVNKRRRIEIDPLLDEKEKMARLDKLHDSLNSNTRTNITRLYEMEKFLYKFIKTACPVDTPFKFEEEEITAFDLIIQNAARVVLENPSMLGLLVEKAYGIRVEEQKNFFQGVKNITKRYSVESSHKLLNDLNEVIHTFMDKLKTFSSSDDKVDVAGASQILKNLEGYLKILIPMSKVLETNNDASEELKRAKIKAMADPNPQTTIQQNQYNILNISLDDLEKAKHARRLDQ